MCFAKKFVTGVFFLFASVSFGEEIVQGQLKNGMSYYLWPDAHQKTFKISLVVKKPLEHISLPAPDVFFVRGSIPQPFFEWTTMGALRFCFFEGVTRNSLQDGLGYLSRFLEEKPCSQEAIDGFREDYRDDIEQAPEEGLELWRMEREIAGLLYGIDPNYADFVFSQDDDFLCKLYRAFFEPSRIALVVTGCFEPSSVEDELKSLFEDISGDSLFLKAAKPKHEKPVIATIKASDIAELMFSKEGDILLPMIAELMFSKEGDSSLSAEREKNFQDVNLCMYQLEPSFKEYVLNDLFLLIHLGSEHFVSFSTGNLAGSDCEIPFFGKLEAPKVDEWTFNQAKTELSAIYRHCTVDKMEQCTNHFLSEIPEHLEPKNQNLLRQLGLVTQEDLDDFINQKIGSAVPMYQFVKK